MKARTFLRRGLAVAALAFAAQLGAQPFPQQGAQEGVGTVDSVSPTTGTVVIDDMTYTFPSDPRARGPSPSAVSKGMRVRFRYTVQGERLILQDIGPAASGR